MGRHALPLASIVLILLLGQFSIAQTNYDTSPSAQTGVQVFGSYFAADIDTVSLFNGNLQLSIPLFSLPGRELPYGLSLAYNGQKWQSDSVNYNTVGHYTGGWTKSNIFGSPLSFFSASSCSIVWIDGAGTKHRYVPRPGDTWGDSCSGNVAAWYWNSRTLVSMDSDGSTLWTGEFMTDGADTARINLKNGNVMYFRTPHSTATYDYVTPNGNYLILGANGLPTQDTLGRSAGYSCTNSCAGSGWTETYTVTDSNGQQNNYKLDWSMASSDTGTSFVDPFVGGAVTLLLLKTITLPNNKTYSFEYANSHGMMTKVTLPSGAYVKYTYTTNPYYGSAATEVVSQRRVSADGTSGSEKLWQYSGVGTYPVTVITPEGNKSVHWFTGQGQESATEWRTSTDVVLKRVENTWTQDYIGAAGQPTNPRLTNSKTYLNGTLFSTKDLVYDTTTFNLTQEKLTERTGGAGMVKNQKDITYTTITGNYTLPSQQTLTAMDPVSGNFVLQGKTQYFYDEYTLTARTGVPNHDANYTSATNRGNLTTVQRYKDANNFVTEHVKYDALGNIVEKDDPLGHPTQIDYADSFCTLDNSNNCTNTTGHSTFAYATAVTNAVTQTLTLTATTKYDYNTGQPTVGTNVRGNSTKTKYDLMNRVTSVTEPNGKLTSYSYDDTNRVTTKQVTVDVGNIGQVKTYFDGLYRTIQTRTNDPEGEIWTDAVYDGNGRKKQVSNPYRGVNGTVPCVGISLCSTTTYDAVDRPLQVQAPDGSVVAYAYAFNQTTVTDEAGNQRRYTYNPVGQLTTVEEPNPSLAWNTPLTTSYKYYGFGPLYQSNQSSQFRTFSYDWLSRMKSQLLPESGTTTFVYDDANRITSKTDARNITTTMSYDNINRPTGKTYSDSTSPVTIGYDVDPNDPQTTYTGLKTMMVDAIGCIKYKYDAMDRLIQEVRVLNSTTCSDSGYSTSYQYNTKGDLTQLTYPSGRVVNFHYASGGGCCNSRLDYVQDLTTGTMLANGISFNAAGETVGRTLNPNGTAISEAFQYNNSRLQLTQISDSIGSTSVMNFTYDYGTASTNTGRVLSRTDALQPEHSQTYTYDSLYRLSQVLSGDKTWSIGWSFDTWGNRLTQTPQGLVNGKVGSPTQSYSNNQATCPQNHPNCYDASGNQTYDGIHNYTFNAENQITQMDGGSASYVYDGEGRRMKKTATINGVTETTYSFYGPGGLLCEFSTVAGTSNATTASSNDRATYRTSDKLGSAVLLITSAGSIIENNRTLPYGEAWLTDTASMNDKKFTTYQRDGESGLDYAINRYFASANGRFTSTDKGPMRVYLPRTLNRYAYGLNDPVNSSDPDGNLVSCPGNPACPPPPPPPLPDCPPGTILIGEACIDPGTGIPVPPDETSDPNQNPTGTVIGGCEQTNVWGVIMQDAWKSGIGQLLTDNFTTNRVSLAGATTDPSTRKTDKITELYMSWNGGDWNQFTAALKADGFQYAGWDPFSSILGHGGYSRSFRQITPDGMWSMQISFNKNTHNISIDIDKYNPLADLRNLGGHFGDVFSGLFNGQDTNYHQAANALGVNDRPCP